MDARLPTFLWEKIHHMEFTNCYMSSHSGVFIRMLHFVLLNWAVSDLVISSFSPFYRQHQTKAKTLKLPLILDAWSKIPGSGCTNHVIALGCEAWWKKMWKKLSKFKRSEFIPALNSSGLWASSKIGGKKSCGTDVQYAMWSSSSTWDRITI